MEDSSFDNLLKPELESMLDDFLRTNQSSWKGDPQLSDYYKRLGSPLKRESGNATSTSLMDTVKKPKSRRQTLKARDDLEQPSETEPSSHALATTTPHTPPSSTLSLARRLPLPASPSLLADRIEAQTTSLTTSASTLYTTSPIPSTLYNMRSYLSSTTSIQLLILAIEAFGLFSRVVPLKYLTTIPAIPAIGIAHETAVRLPDMFALLTSDFWGPVGLWLATNILVPAMGAWFLNLRALEEGNGDGYDPVAFGVVKGLLGWIVYVRRGVGGESRGVVEDSVPGGGVGMLVGAGIAVLGGMYEAVLRK
ncbi:MAG: hypothetical protein LQ346_000961 [Caloplaca aetnensis]|nr:MAG: hypothetical protein LQ346_000961 [Caloplaca aetnensis]